MSQIFAKPFFFEEAQKEVNDIYFHTEHDAETVLKEIKRIIGQCSCCYLEDYFDLAGIDSKMNYGQEFGWINVDHAKVIERLGAPLDEDRWTIEGLAESLVDLREENLAVYEVRNMMKQPKNDPINHPSHYCSGGGIECIDAIASVLSTHTDAYAGWLTGQILKYIWRWNLKNGLEDLKKAQFYLNKLIEHKEEN